jgi:integrase
LVINGHTVENNAGFEEVISVARRGNGEGYIRHRKDGSWEGQYTAGYDLKTGKIIRRSVYARTRSDVVNKMSDKIKEARNGICSDFDNATVAEWMEFFLWELKKPHIKPKTFSGYEEDINRYINTAAIARIKIKDLRRHHIQEFINTLVSDSCPPFLIHRIYRTFRNAINEAEKQNAIQISYANGITLPKKNPKPVRTLSKSEQSVFFDAIKRHRLKAAFIVALATGIREEELTALTWDDYNSNVISITKNAVRVNKYDTRTRKKVGSHIIVQDTPKTDTGIRDIPLMEIAVDALDHHRIEQDNERKKNRLAYEDQNLIFCNEFGGLYDPKHFYCELRKTIKAAGIEHIKFHGLRHTFATWGLEEGIADKSMQELLGHKTPEMVMHYQHLRKEHARIEIDKLAKAFKQSCVKPKPRGLKFKRPKNLTNSG